MPTNRPFFQNFIAAFRAHNALQKATSGHSPSGATHSTMTAVSAAAAVASARNIATKAASTSANPVTTASTSPSNPSSAAVSSSTAPLSRSPVSPSATSSPINTGAAAAAASRRRRSSSSSSGEGFRDALGGQQWFIGGRTLAGEERFYKLGMTKRHRSIDRLSLDRLSLD